MLFRSEISGPSPEIAAWCFYADNVKKPRDLTDRVDESADALPVLPSYFQRHVAVEAELPKPLTPSGATLDIDDDVPADQKQLNISPVLGEKPENALFAIERGNVIHRLLQYLPQCKETERRELALEYLKKTALDWTDNQRKDAYDQVFKVMDHPTLQPLFAPESRAEVALMGIVEIKGKKHAVSGQIDRLNDAGETIILGDFKTGRVPKSEAQIPTSYLLQMALYRNLLKAIHPKKMMKTLLIYSDGPKVFELDAEKLDNMLYKESNNLHS